MEKITGVLHRPAGAPRHEPAQKLQGLVRAAGLGKIDMDQKVRGHQDPFWRAGQSVISEAGLCESPGRCDPGAGRPALLTDCNTLYVGRRKHALEHIEAAYENGFTPFPPAARLSLRTD